MDNGKGILYDDLCMVGERYMTSKRHTIDNNTKLNYFGYRGEAIASIVDVSGAVEICSRHILSQSTYSKVFHNGKPMHVTTSKSHRPSVGTTVSIHNFFYNLPVRRKGMSAALELEQVRRVVESIALINPSVSFSVRNDATGQCVLQTPKTNSVMSRFGLLFGNDKTASMKGVSLSHADFELSGFMSTKGHHNKSLQFIYVNDRMVSKTPLHSYVNNMLASFLSTRKLSEVADSSGMHEEWKNGVFSPRRTSDLFGMYILCIKCSKSEYDICLEPAKTLIEFKDWNQITSALGETVQRFLLNNSLISVPINLTPCDFSPHQQESSKFLVISDKTHDVCAHEPTGRIMTDFTLEPSLQSQTVRFSHYPLSKAVTRMQYSRAMEDTDTTRENDTDNTFQIGRDEENRLCVSMFDDDKSVPEGFPIASTKEAVVQNNELTMPPLTDHLESGYPCQGGDKPSIKCFTNSKSLQCLPCSNEQENRPITYCHESGIYATIQRTSVTSTCTSPVETYSNNSLQKRSCSSFVTIPPWITNDSTRTSSSSLGQLVDASHIQFEHSKDSSNDSSAPLLSSIATSNKCSHSQVSYTCYRSPLQSSSISSKLSKLFRRNPTKNGSASRSVSQKTCHVTHQRPQPSSLASYSLQEKRSSLNADCAYPKPLHDEGKPLPQPLVTLSESSAHTGYISLPGNGFNVVQSTLNSASISVHSHVSVTTTAVVTLPVPNGVLRPSYSLVAPSKPATESYYTLCPMEATTSVCTYYDSVLCSSANKNPNVVSGACDSKGCDDSTSCCMPPQICEAITNQGDSIENERSITNAGFTEDSCITNIDTSSAGKVSTSMLSSVSNCSNGSQSAALVVSSSQKPVWKEVIDPVTKQTLYIHSKSGNCVTSLPQESSTSSETLSSASVLSKDNLHNPVSSSCARGSPPLDITSGHLACLDTELSQDAIYTYYQSKAHCRRISLNMDRSSISEKHGDLSICSLLADHHQWTQLPDTKWRHQTKPTSITGCEIAESIKFNDIFKRWKNPTFQGGEEVS